MKKGDAGTVSGMTKQAKPVTPDTMSSRIYSGTGSTFITSR